MAPPSRRRRDARIAGPLPKTLDLTLGNQIYIAKEALSPGPSQPMIGWQRSKIPNFYKAQAMRLSTFDKPRIYRLRRDHPQHIGLPRGCLDDLLQTLSALNIKPVVHDQRNCGEALDVTFRVNCVPSNRCAQAMLAQDMGCWPPPLRSEDRGAAWLIAQPRCQYARIGASTAIATAMGRAAFYLLGNPARAIGRIGGARKTPPGSSTWR